MKKAIMIPLAIVFILITNVAPSTYIETSGKIPSAKQEFVLEAISWKSFAITCFTGDSLSGEFTLTSNGDLFTGDQTKYDNWLLDGIDFLILDAANYELWVEDSSVSPLYERKGVVELEWSVEIPSEGIWYIIYNNDSIFMKQVEGNIQRVSQSGFISTLVIVSLLILTALLALIYMFRKKK